jgi:hypothetical protein
MVTVCLYFDHLLLLLLVVEDVATGWASSACNVAVLVLRSCFVDRPASATATFADIKSDFVPKLDWLEALVVVKFRAAISRIRFVSDM